MTKKPVTWESILPKSYMMTSGHGEQSAYFEVVEVINALKQAEASGLVARNLPTEEEIFDIMLATEQDTEMYSFRQRLRKGAAAISKRIHSNE